MGRLSAGSHTPDYRRLLNVITGERAPDRLPFVDLRADDAIVEALAGRPAAVGETATERRRSYAEALVTCALALDFDMVWARSSVPFPRTHETRGDPSGVGGRDWQSGHGGGMVTWQALEETAWPEPGAVDVAPVEALALTVPEGMGIFTTTSGVFENASRLMGMEGLSYAMVDDPDLVSEVFRRVGERVLAHVAALAKLDCVRACWMGEDMGHRTGLLVPPSLLREHAFPWLARIVGAVHAQGKPFVLHSCGNVAAVMDEAIAMGIDAKHSFEDAILPVADAVRLWGDRIGILGGVDVHLLAHGTEEDVRRVTRETIAACAPSGRWALGSGNSFASYIPPGNYLAMLDEGRRVWPG